MLAELHRCCLHVVRGPRRSVSAEPHRQLDVEGIEVDIADILEELGGSGLDQRLGQLVLFSRQMEQRHQRLVAAAACCIWLLTVVAPLSGQAEPPHVTELRRAAEQGTAAAQFNLGGLYYDGEGVPQDYGEAVRWYRLAADQGYAAAQHLLAAMYAYGHGVPQDYGEALRWDRLAADQGLAGAQAALGAMHYNGLGVPRDYGEAVRWYRLAADQGYAHAQAALGLMYIGGWGVPQDYIAAHMWTNLAAAQGDENARKLRDGLAGRMSSEQIAAAQRAAREWRPVSQIQSR